MCIRDRITSGEGLRDVLVSYRTGDMWAPQIEQPEALRVELIDFLADCVSANVLGTLTHNLFDDRLIEVELGPLLVHAFVKEVSCDATVIDPVVAGAKAADTDQAINLAGGHCTAICDQVDLM